MADLYLDRQVSSKLFCNALVNALAGFIENGTDMEIENSGIDGHNLLIVSAKILNVLI